MAPEVAAEAMRAYAEETNRLNRERRANAEADRKALADIERKLKDIVAAIEDGGYTRMLSDRLRVLEAQQDEIAERLARAPINIPDIHPNVADTYRRKVVRLADALNHPEDRYEAAAALRGLIERIVLAPGSKRGELHATLHGELGTIIEWFARTKPVRKGTKACATTEFPGLSVSVHARVSPYSTPSLTLPRKRGRERSEATREGAVWTAGSSPAVTKGGGKARVADPSKPEAS